MPPHSDLPLRVLPADVFDALEFGALAFGGIGAGTFFAWLPGHDILDSDYDRTCPICAHGLAAAVEDVLSVLDRSVIGDALFAAGIDYRANDEAVRAINARLGVDEDARVSFEDWCAELGVVRGDS